jgi:hypothetical protein
MTPRIEVSTGRYEQIFGCKPQGYALWYFCLPGGRTYSHAGTYAAALRAAARHVRSAGQDVIRMQVIA